MPQLIKGHMHFTDEDYLLHDYESSVRANTHNQTQALLINQLADEVRRLNMMSRDDRAKYESLYNTIYKETLQKALMTIVAVAHTEGYTLAELFN